jgi:hypothetical protein
MLRRLILLMTLLTGVISCNQPSKSLEIIFNNPKDKDYVIGINNLKIDEVNYSVRFKFGTFFDIFGNPINSDFSRQNLPFWGNQEKTMLAVNKIVDALNTIDPSSACVLNKFQPYCVFFIPMAADSEVTAMSWAGGRTVQTNYKKHQLLAVQGTLGIDRSYALISEIP